MGWDIPWYTMIPDPGRAFDVDFGVDEWHGTNAVIREDDGRVFRTYFNNRGDEAFVTTWNFLDMTALGRQERWEGCRAGLEEGDEGGQGNGGDLCGIHFDLLVGVFFRSTIGKECRIGLLSVREDY